MLTVSGMTKAFGRITALDDVAFRIEAGEILGLIGPNGAGKTTLFECIAGVQPADRGEVRANGELAPPDARKGLLFYVPDGIGPWRDQRVAWVLDFVVGFFGGRASAKAAIVDRLQIAPLFRSTIGTLSKGQRKRVLLAIGLLTPQPLLLIDEPFEGLDLRQTRDVAAALHWHVREHARTLFLSIHQIGHAATVCDRFVLLSGGRIRGEGTLEELARAAESSGATLPSRSLEDVFLTLT